MTGRRIFWLAAATGSVLVLPVATVAVSCAGPRATLRAALRAAPEGSVARPCDGGWSCAQQERFAAATTLLERYPGRIGLVVRDRTTGVV